MRRRPDAIQGTRLVGAKRSYRICSRIRIIVALLHGCFDLIVTKSGGKVIRPLGPALQEPLVRLWRCDDTDCRLCQESCNRRLAIEQNIAGTEVHVLVSQNARETVVSYG